MVTVRSCSSPRCPSTGRRGSSSLLKVADADGFQPDPVLDVVTEFEDTHFGTREMTVRDPDGRIWSLQAPGRVEDTGARDE